MVKGCDRTRHEKVSELHPKELCLLMHNEKGAVHRLNDYYGSLVRSEVADEEIECISLQHALVYLKIL